MQYMLVYKYKSLNFMNHSFAGKRDQIHTDLDL